MRKVSGSVFALLAVAAVAATPADAGSCSRRAAVGEALTRSGAKFQVDEALLQATDWGAWATWMASGTTPGYRFGPRAYRCNVGGALGWTCHGSATICRL